jgi:hypothetical protein
VSKHTSSPIKLQSLSYKTLSPHIPPKKISQLEIERHADSESTPIHPKSSKEQTPGEY